MKELLTSDKANQMSIAEQITECFNNPGGARDMFYDWFCKDSSLDRKAASLIGKLERIADSPRFDKNHHYAFFKNNCPMHGSLYDSFSICSLTNGDVRYWICPKNGHQKYSKTLHSWVNQNEGEVMGRAESGSFVLLFTGTWSQIVYWFNHPKEVALAEALKAKQAEVAALVRAEEKAAEELESEKSMANSMC